MADVRERYDARFLKTPVGLWAVTPSHPLGLDGPQFHLSVFLPGQLKAPPSGWALSKLGMFPKFVGPRHTNFPYHDICAQGSRNEAWGPADGIRPLLNLYSTWLLRHCYLAEVGRWPGRQWGATALYRRKEFHPDEWCGCGKVARYRDCHMDADFALSEEQACLEHRSVMSGDYCPRNPPKAVKAFARSGWNKVPDHPFV